LSDQPSSEGRRRLVGDLVPSLVLSQWVILRGTQSAVVPFFFACYMFGFETTITSHVIHRIPSHIKIESMVITEVVFELRYIPIVTIDWKTTGSQLTPILLSSSTFMLFTKMGRYLIPGLELVDLPSRAVIEGAESVVVMLHVSDMLEHFVLASKSPSFGFTRFVRTGVLVLS